MKNCFGLVVLAIACGVGPVEAVEGAPTMVQPLSTKVDSIQGGIKDGDYMTASFGIGNLFDSGAITTDVSSVDARSGGTTAAAAPGFERPPLSLERGGSPRRKSTDNGIEELGPIAGAVETTGLLYPVVKDVVDIMDKASKNVDAEGEKRAREGAEKQREAEKKWEGKERNYPQYQEKK